MAKIKAKEIKEKRESGMPGGGAGRRDEIGRSGVYRVSGPHPRGDAPIVAMASWGQGERGATGYEDHGESELFVQHVTPEKCRDIMTKDPVCCLAGDTAVHAAQLMKEHDVGILPIVENQKNKKLSAIVTDRDLVLKLMADGLDPWKTAVERAMSRPVIACSPDDGYDEALKLMETHKVKRVPVVDNSGRVVGMISQGDVALRIRDRQKTAEVVESICQPDLARA
ncbi:MAG: CBS domain-containing protein [Bryobacteraceae bacterium]|jgi:CBS domain-containing protein